MFDLGQPLLGATGRGRDPRTGTESRRPREQRRPGVVRTGRDGGRVRGDLGHQSPRALPAHQPPAGADQGVGARTHRQRGVDGAQRRPQGNVLRRPPVREEVRHHARLRAVETGEHPLHPGAGPPPRGQRGDGELAASRDGAHRLRGRRRRPGPARLRDQEPRRSSCPRHRVPGPRSTWPQTPRWRRSAASTSSSARRSSPSAGRTIPRRRVASGRSARSWWASHRRGSERCGCSSRGRLGPSAGPRWRCWRHGATKWWRPPGT